MEVHAIKRIFGDDAAHVAVHTLKSTVGESLGASGALQVACSLQALAVGVIPPTINYEEPEAGFKLEGVSNQAVQREVTIAMINTFGCDGNNASLLLRYR